MNNGVIIVDEPIYTGIQPNLNNLLKIKIEL